MRQHTIIRGGITLKSDVRGNITIHARGDGYADVQHADLPDLHDALAQLLAHLAIDDVKE